MPHRSAALHLGDEVRIKPTSDLREVVGDEAGRIVAMYELGDAVEVVVQGTIGFTAPLPADDFDLVAALRDEA